VKVNLRMMMAQVGGIRANEGDKIFFYIK